MEQDIGAKIQELVGNPDVVRKKSKSDRHKYYKRPGRGHNRDTCDACDDVGDILCCDSCPSSFHLECIDPPLEEKDLPVGGWQCQSCSTLKKERNGKTKAQPVEDMEVDHAAPTGDALIIRNTFKQMIMICKRANPREFHLPSDYANYSHMLPGTSKPVVKKGKKSKPAFTYFVEPDNKKRKRIISTCYTCDMSTRVGALIECDFCQMKFHLDCLDPPLTVVPTCVWSCPLHPEPLLESKLIKASGVTERVKIWDHSQTPLNPMTVTLDFLTKAHSFGPSGRKTFLEQYSQLKIPPHVMDVYSGFRDENATKSTPFTSVPSRLYSDTFQIPCVKEHAVPVSMEESADALPYVEEPITNVLVQSAEELTVLENPVQEHPVLVPLVGELTLIAPAVEKSNTQNPSTKEFEKLGKIQTNFDLLVQAADLKRNENVVDNLLKDIHPQTVKLLAVKKLLEDPKLAFLLKPFEGPKSDGVGRPANQHVLRSETAVSLTPSLTLISLSDGKKIEFRRRCIEVGTGGSASLDLSKFGSCKRIAKRHASIFYDQVKCRWELLNYSESGTLVNNCLYGCDVTKHASLTKPKEETLPHFNEIVSERKKAMTAARNINTRSMNLTPSILMQESCLCAKKWSSIPTNCWEGSAFIKAEDVLQMGCLKFVVVSTGHVEERMTNTFSFD